MKKNIVSLTSGALFFVLLLFLLQIPARDAASTPSRDSSGDPSETAELSFLDRQRLFILKSIIAKNLPRDLLVKHIDTFLLGLRGAEITGLKMTENVDFLEKHSDMDPVFFEAERVLIRINPLRLLLGQVHVQKMTIDNPTYQLVRDEEGNWNFDDLSQAQDSKLIKWLRVSNLSINNARLNVLDHGAPHGPIPSTIRQVDVAVSDFTIGQIFNLDIKAASPGSPKQNVFLHGQAGPMEIRQKNEQIPVDAGLKVTALPVVSHNRQAFPSDSPVLPEAGNLNIDFHLTGDAWSGLTMTGRLDVDNLIFRSADNRLKGEPINVGLHLKQPMTLSLEKDRLSMPLLNLDVNGNVFHITGSAGNLRGRSEAMLEVGTEKLDMDVIQSVYPFLTDAFPEEVRLGGSLDMNVRLQGSTLRSRINGRMDLTGLEFGFADYFYKPARERLVMSVDGLLSSSGVIEARGDVSVENCQLGHYNFIMDMLNRLLQDTEESRAREQLLADYARLPHVFDAVEGSIRYTGDQVRLERMVLSNLRPAEKAGINGILDGTLDLNAMAVNIRGHIAVSESLTRRIVEIDPHTARLKDGRTLVLGFQHTGSIEDLNLEIFPRAIQLEQGRVENRSAPVQ